jgi:hypothetical protein
MELPQRIRTKREALELLDQLFPEHGKAMLRCNGDSYPYYTIDQATRDNLRDVFNWLMEKNTRIYKRPRWHLFYLMSQRVVELTKENHGATWRYHDRQHWDKEWKKKQAAWIMEGDGQGI